MRIIIGALFILGSIAMLSNKGSESSIGAAIVLGIIGLVIIFWGNKKSGAPESVTCDVCGDIIQGGRKFYNGNLNGKDVRICGWCKNDLMKENRKSKIEAMKVETKCDVCSSTIKSKYDENIEHEGKTYGKVCPSCMRKISTAKRKATFDKKKPASQILIVKCPTCSKDIELTSDFKGRFTCQHCRQTLEI